MIGLGPPSQTLISRLVILPFQDARGDEGDRGDPPTRWGRERSRLDDLHVRRRHQPASGARCPGLERR